MSVAPTPPLMTADEFLEWAIAQPEGRYELVSGEVFRMAAEQVEHARAKFRIAKALDAGITAKGLPCEAFTDGMAVRISDRTVYEPDATVRCGPPLSGRAVQMTDPIIVVEVLSPSTRSRDAGAKFEDYFRLPSVRHYLIVKTDTGSVIHHARGEDGAIASSIRREGVVTLDPPGLTLDLAALLPAE